MDAAHDQGWPESARPSELPRKSVRQALWVGTQPCLKCGQIKLMAANLGVAVEQQRHVPAIFLPERWIAIDVDEDQPVSGPHDQRTDFRFHVLA